MPKIWVQTGDILSDWFYLAREYVVPILLALTGLSCQRGRFYLVREYVVPIILVLTDFILPESLWCLFCWFSLVLFRQRVCGAYFVGCDWFYLAREYVVPILLVMTGFILPESMWCLLCWV